MPDPDDETIRCIAVLSAGDGAPPAELQSLWLRNDPFADLMDEHVMRYLRSVPLPSEERGFRPKANYGVMQVWVQGVRRAIALAEALEERAATARGSMLEASRIFVLPTREYALIDGPERRGGADGIKAFYFSSRKPGMSVDDFQNHWLHVHGPLVPPSPGITRYVQCHPCPEWYAKAQPPFDALAELTFPDRAAQEAFATSPETREQQSADLPNLFDLTGGAMRFYLEDRFDTKPTGGSRP